MSFEIPDESRDALEHRLKTKVRSMAARGRTLYEINNYLEEKADELLKESGEDHPYDF